jgi:hypothetical protein
MFEIAPHQSVTETVTYTPNSTNDDATVTIFSNDAKRGTFEIKLRGRGLVGRLGAPNDFRIVGDTIGQPTSADLTIRNRGGGLLAGRWSSVAPTTTAPYTVTGDNFSLMPGASETIKVDFTPAGKGRSADGALILTVDSPSLGSKTIMLKGIGK